MEKKKEQIMETIYIIIRGGKIWTELYFPSLAIARNYLKMRVPQSHFLKEIEENKFESKRYGSQYRINALNNYSTEQKRIANEFSTLQTEK